MNMNENLQNALAECIKSIVNGKDFIISQAPDSITQLLRWEMVSSLIWAGFWFLILGIAVALLIKAIKWKKDPKNRYDWDSDGYIIVVPTIVFFIGLIGMFSNMTWIQILIAPKAYLLEYATRMF